MKQSLLTVIVFIQINLNYCKHVIINYQFHWSIFILLWYVV